MNTQDLPRKPEYSTAAAFVRNRTHLQPHIALILGSGLGDFAHRIDIESMINSSDIPFYPVPSVSGHAGKILFGYLKKDIERQNPIAVFQGRIHFYEAEALERVLFPIALARSIGIQQLVITNAAGGINTNFSPGDLMIIQDILNFSFPALPCPPSSSRHVRRIAARLCDPGMKQTMLQSARQLKIPLTIGTYAWLRGPSYETPAEIQMLKRIGADAVGMSTVPEILYGYQSGMRILGISLISNYAAGISPSKLSHAEVTETGARVAHQVADLLEGSILSFHNEFCAV